MRESERDRVRERVRARVRERARLRERARERATHSDVAVRFDLVDPKALLHHRACPVQQLLQLAQGERSHQVTDVDDVGDFASGRRGQFVCADWIVDGNRHTRLLLTDGATHQSITGSD